MTCITPQRLTVSVGLRRSDITREWHPCSPRDAERVVTASGEVWLADDEWVVRAEVAAEDIEPLFRHEEQRLREAIDDAFVDAIERQTPVV